MTPKACPTFSLILCTADTGKREVEITRLLTSLVGQRFVDFEVVVVDQNDNYDMGRLLAPFTETLSINHITSLKGLSRSRNQGMAVARGQLCAFPDDDCWYAPDILARVAAFFASEPGQVGLHGKGSDPQTGLDMARFDTTSGPIIRSNVFERSVSCALFYRSENVRAVGGFDENLGLGSGTRWNGCEDYDLPIQLLDAGQALTYHSELLVFHPCPSLVYDRELIRRAASQSPSFGYLLTRHRFPATFVAMRTLRPLGGCLVGLAKGDLMKVRYHWAAALGRVKGAASGLLESATR